MKRAFSEEGSLGDKNAFLEDLTAILKANNAVLLQR